MGGICGLFVVCTHGWMDGWMIVVVVVVGFGEEKCGSVVFTMCDSFVWVLEIAGMHREKGVGK